MLHFQGLVFRAHDPKWASSPLSGKGAKRYGGRFNKKGQAALYTSLSQTTAFIEYQQGFIARPQPVTICAYEVNCTDIVDLTDNTELNKYGISQNQLNCNWEYLAADKKIPPSWIIAESLILKDVAGIIVPSFAHNSSDNDKNLILWSWSNNTPHQIKLIDNFNKTPSE